MSCLAEQTIRDVDAAARKPAQRLPERHARRGAFVAVDLRLRRDRSPPARTAASGNGCRAPAGVPKRTAHPQFITGCCTAPPQRGARRHVAERGDGDCQRPRVVLPPTSSTSKASSADHRPWANAAIHGSLISGKVNESSAKRGAAPWRRDRSNSRAPHADQNEPGRWSAENVALRSGCQW